VKCLKKLVFPHVKSLILTPEQYNTCVDAHADGVYRFLLHNTRDSEQAKDIVQDTFEKLWINLGNVNYEKSKSYIFTTAYHTMIDKIRRGKKQASWEEVNEGMHSHSKQYSDLKEILKEAIDKLPEIQRSVILLRDYEGYSYEEIGEITSLNESQVKVYIYRARVALKEYIGSMQNVI
jgi:RNA polymerase sigma factor (sigma-70 family)